MRARSPSVIVASAVASVLALNHRSLAGPNWDGGGANDLWSTAANWNSDTLPPNDGTSNIMMTGTTRLTPDMNAAWSILSLTFSTTAGAFNLNSTGNHTMTLGSGGMSNSSGDLCTINTAVTLLGAGLQTWTSNAASPITLTRTLTLNNRDLTLTGSDTISINSAISGVGGVGNGIRKTGSGSLLFGGSASNNYEGDTTFDSGTLVLAKTGGAIAIPVGAFFIGDGAGTDTVVINGTNQFHANAGLQVSGSGVILGNNHLNSIGGLNMDGGTLSSVNFRMPTVVNIQSFTNTSRITSGTLDLRNGNTNFSVTDGSAAVDFEVAATIQNGSLTKSGGGLMRLAGNNTFAGGAFLQGGSTSFASATAFGTSTITLNGGTLAVDSIQSLSNRIVLTGAERIAGTLGTSLILSGALSGSGGFTIHGGTTVALMGTISNTHLGTIVIDNGALVLEKTGGANAIGFGTVVVGNGSSISELVLNGPNQFSAFATLDVRSLSNVAGNSQSNVLSQIIMSGGEIDSPNLTLNTSLTSLAGSTGALIRTGTLSLGGGVRGFSIANGAPAVDMDLQAAMDNGGIIKSGPGTLRLSALNTYGAGTTLSAGTLILANNSALGTGPLTSTGTGVIVAEGAGRTINNALVLTSDLTVHGSTSLTLNGASSGAGALLKSGTATLTIGGAHANTGGTTLNSGTLVLASPSAAGAATLTIGASTTGIVQTGLSSAVTMTSLVVGSGATLNLNDNSLAINYTGATPVDSIRTMTQSAYGTGSWNGTGLTSSPAATASATSTPTAVGIAEATDLFTSFPAMFQGQSVDNTTVLVMYTLSGDATLDATVNSADFNLLATNFGTSGQYWYKGDFTYNGTIDSADFNVLASNFGKTLASAAGGSVPEPQTLIGAAAFSGVLATRRRRRVCGSSTVPFPKSRSTANSLEFA